MIHLSRLGTLSLIAGGMLSFSVAYAGETALHPAGNLPELLFANSSQGYLGVGIHDVDNDRASALKLKDAHGAEILTIDQDAPAGKAGLKVHDVVVQMNGQRIEGVEQFRRMLRETPPGRTIALVIIRSSQPMNISVQLADRTEIGPKIIGGLQVDPPPSLSSDDVTPQVLPGGASGRTRGSSNDFLGTFSRNRNYVGVDLQPLPTGLAEYFGVRGGSGLLVGNVFPNSPAATAGLKAADVVQKVNGQPIVSLSDWERAIRANRGKQVQVVVVRDKKEQTLNMIAGTTKTGSELDLPEFNLPSADRLAEMESQIAGIDASALADQISKSVSGIDAEALRQQAQKAVNGIDKQEIQKAVEESQKQWKDSQKQIEQQMQELKRQFESMHFEQMD